MSIYILGMRVDSVVVVNVTVAPPIGAVMVYLWGWRSTSALQTILGIMALLSTLFFLPETLNKERAKSKSVIYQSSVIYMLINFLQRYH